MFKRKEKLEEKTKDYYYDDGYQEIPLDVSEVIEGFNGERIKDIKELEEKISKQDDFIEQIRRDLYVRNHYYEELNENEYILKSEAVEVERVTNSMFGCPEFYTFYYTKQGARYYEKDIAEFKKEVEKFKKTNK